MTITVSGSSGVTFPAGGVGNPAGTVVGTTDTQTLTSKTLSGAIWTSPSGSTITSGTSQASTSGTSIDFTSIPSWVKRVTVMFNGVSTNGTSPILIQVGAGSVTTSGYVGGAQQISTAPSQTALSSGFMVAQAVAAANTYSGHAVVNNLTSNTWAANGIVGRNDGPVLLFGGAVTLSGTLDRLRVTTVNGTDTFDAGSINILYE